MKTFRDEDGLWNGYDVYEVATPRAFKKNPSLVLEFYNMRRRDVAAAKPNAAHIALAQLESHYKVTIVTQNIDDLHERAGSTNILHLHGEIFKMRSVENEALITEVKDDIKLGDLASDGAQQRPHIVWFEEPVPLIEDAGDIMATADIFILIGTSLQVYPAAGLIQFLPHGIPKYIIDKKIPPLGNLPCVHLIEKPSTEGLIELKKILLSDI